VWAWRGTQTRHEKPLESGAVAITSRDKARRSHRLPPSEMAASLSRAIPQVRDLPAMGWLDPSLRDGRDRGHSGTKGTNALLAIVSTPASAPVIAATRLRKGSTTSAKPAHRFVADALVTATAAGATGTLVLRADSAFYQPDVIAAVRRRKARFSITARKSPPVRAAIAAIDAQTWTPIKYTNAIWDHDAQAWISDAEVAEIAFTTFTAFTSKPKAEQVSAG